MYKDKLTEARKTFEAEKRRIMAEIPVRDMLKAYGKLWSPRNSFSSQERYYRLNDHSLYLNLYLGKVDSLVYVEEFIEMLKEDPRLKFESRNSYNSRITAKFRFIGPAYYNRFYKLTSHTIDFDFQTENSERCELVIVKTKMIESHEYELKCNGVKQ